MKKQTRPFGWSRNGLRVALPRNIVNTFSLLPPEAWGKVLSLAWPGCTARPLIEGIFPTENDVFSTKKTIDIENKFLLEKHDVFLHGYCRKSITK
jgi:hypothetical protein